MKKLCLNCQQPIAHKRGGAKFCSLECKNAYRYKHKRNEATPKKPTSHIAGPLNGIDKSTPPIDKQGTETSGPVNPSENALPVPKNEPLVFSNVIYSHTGLPVNEQPKPETPIVLPPQFLTQMKVEPNPDYTGLESRINFIDKNLAVLEKSILEIRCAIEEVRARDGKNHIMLGAGAGAYLGYEMSKAGKGTKGPGLGGVLLILFFGGLGALAGNGARSISEAGREREKAKELSILNARLSEALKQHDTLKTDKNRLVKQILGIPPMMLKQVQVTNPAYGPALKKQQEQQARLEKAAQNSRLGSPYPKGEDPHETGRILSAAAMSQLSTVILDFKDPWLTLLGKPQTNFKMLVSGESGSGKSHFAIQLAMYLAGFGRVLYVSGEEGFATTFQDKIRTMGADRHPNFYTGDFRTGTELLTEAPNLYHFIVIDSINDMGISYEQYLQIIERFSQSGIVALFQSTKAGKFRGSNEFIHKSDIAVRVEGGIATTVKNRYKAAGQTFDVMKIYKDDGH